MVGCWKPENIELAEQAMENGEYLKAAESYSKQIEMVNEDKEIGLLSLNTGLAYLQGNNIEMAEKFLEDALENLSILRVFNQKPSMHLAIFTIPKQTLFRSARC